MKIRAAVLDQMQMVLGHRGACGGRRLHPRGERSAPWRFGGGGRASGGHCLPCQEGRPALCEPGAPANGAAVWQVILLGHRQIDRQWLLPT